MKSFKYIFIVLFFSASSLLAQSDTIKDLYRGANILARQFYFNKDIHRAKALTKFVTLIDEDNPKNETLIANIRENKPVRVYQTLEDNGIAYSNFLYELMNTLEDKPSTRQKRISGYYICSILNPASPAKNKLPGGSYFKDFYSDIFPDDEDKPMRKILASRLVNDLVIDFVTFKPSEILDTINVLNYKMRNTGTQIEVESEKIEVEFVEEEEGYKVYEGPKVHGSDKTTILNNVKLGEVLKYIEHTTRLTYKLEGHTILIKDSGRNRDGKPEFLLKPQTLLDKIQESLIKSRAEYDNKTIQIRGIVTQIKDSGSRFLIELNDVFVVIVGKSRLKADSVKIITQKFTEYAEAKKSNNPRKMAQNRPHLILVVRGICQIKKINQIYINHAFSILAEDAGHFYTK